MSTAVNKKRKYKIKEVKASLVRRGTAFMIDWYIGSVLTSLPVLAILQKVNPNAEPVLEMRILPYTMAILASILALIVTITYYVVLPYIWKGQTLGKNV